MPDATPCETCGNTGVKVTRDYGERVVEWEPCPDCVTPWYSGCAGPKAPPPETQGRPDRLDENIDHWRQYANHLEAALDAERENAATWKRECIAAREAGLTGLYEHFRDKLTDELDKQAGAAGVLAVANVLVAGSEARANAAEARCRELDTAMRDVAENLEGEARASAHSHPEIGAWLKRQADRLRAALEADRDG